MKNTIDKVGGFGAVFAAAVCPICFPKLAAIGALLGLGVLAPFEIYFLWGAQIFVLLSLLGQFRVFQRTKNIALLLVSILFVVLFFLSLYVVVSETLSYIALTGIVLGSIWMVIAERKQKICRSRPG